MLPGSHSSLRTEFERKGEYEVCVRARARVCVCVCVCVYVCVCVCVCFFVFHVKNTCGRFLFHLCPAPLLAHQARRRSRSVRTWPMSSPPCQPSTPTAHVRMVLRSLSATVTFVFCLCVLSALMRDSS
jgi:hypothetical protein